MIDELQRRIDKVMNEQNNQGLPDFEGYSPIEMTRILYYTFEDQSPIRFVLLNKKDYEKIPIVKQILYFANLIQKNGEIKLTQKGFLPTKIVADLCSQEFLMDERMRYAKTYKEADSMSATLTRIIMDLSGLIKKRNNKISLTKNGEKQLSDTDKLFKTIITAYCKRFNWAYFDAYGDNNIGQFGFGFSIILLSKYGYEKRLDEFYFDKYLNAFPKLIAESPPTRYGHKFKDPKRCYSLRTFDRFMDYFGLVKIEQEKWDSEKYICKTELFDRLVKCTPHNIGSKTTGRIVVK
ncbi:MAG: hypothetical protein U9Q98_10635 [Bacteroidota bacterium]|nr:hypothetical protein [Bacteroidota bacterium]